MNTTLTIDMTHLPNSIPLGRCGENHTVICFDCTSYLEAYGEGSAALLFQPAQGSMHPVVVEQTGALVTWRVSASDTAASGSGSENRLEYRRTSASTALCASTQWMVDLTLRPSAGSPPRESGSYSQSTCVTLPASSLTQPVHLMT